MRQVTGNLENSSCPWSSAHSLKIRLDENFPSGLQPCCRKSVTMFAPCLTHGSSARWTKKVGRRQRRNRDFWLPKTCTSRTREHLLLVLITAFCWYRFTLTVQTAPRR